MLPAIRNFLVALSITLLPHPPTAGAELIADSLEHDKITAAQATRDREIPRSRLCDIFAGRKGVSTDTALRIERYIGVPSRVLILL